MSHRNEFEMKGNKSWPDLREDLPVDVMPNSNGEFIPPIPTDEQRQIMHLARAESDRLAAMAEGLTALGASVRLLPDGWEIQGPRHLEGARVESRGDHRVAMALAVAGLLAEGSTEIEDAECVEISYPGFWDQLEALCSR